jgi:hypothetical protein
MAKERVGLYTRITLPGGTRRYEKINPKKPYPLGTPFFLRFRDPKTRKRVWEQMRGNNIDLRLALAKAKIREGYLLMPEPEAPGAPAGPKRTVLANAKERDSWSRSGSPRRKTGRGWIRKPCPHTRT